LYSEALSLELLTRLHPTVALDKTEREISYTHHACKITDYTCIVDNVHRIGVSVTRAMSFGVAYNEKMAEGLLRKKLKAIESSNKHVSEEDRWKKQILHIMCSDVSVANVLNNVVRVPTSCSKCRNQLIKQLDTPI
jgi:hypothetical protein